MRDDRRCGNGCDGNCGDCGKGEEPRLGLSVAPGQVWMDAAGWRGDRVIDFDPRTGEPVKGRPHFIVLFRDASAAVLAAACRRRDGWTQTLTDERRVVPLDEMEDPGALRRYLLVQG